MNNKTIKKGQLIKSLISAIEDPNISSLSDIAKLSYSVFLRRVGNKLRVSWSHHLYQHAIHSAEEGERRANMLRNNPQFKNISSLNSRPSSKETKHSTSSTKPTLSGE